MTSSAAVSLGTEALSRGTHASAGAPTRRGRLVVALAIGVAVAAYICFQEQLLSRWVGDIVQSWAGARALGRGENPYAAVGPTGTLFRWPWPLFYPVPALLLVAPLAPLPLSVFRPLFLGASSAWLAYVATRHTYWRIALFASAAFLGSLTAGAWEPLLLAAALTPGAAALYLAKPNIGLALALALPRNRATRIGLGLALALFIASLVIQPRWIGEWHHALSVGGTHLAGPITRPGGIIALVALARWRRAEARLLLMLATVPQTMIVQAALPLFVVARTRMEIMVLAMLSYIPFAIQLHNAWLTMPFKQFTDRTGTALVVCLYLPCVVMLLRRPNTWTPLDHA